MTAHDPDQLLPAQIVPELMENMPGIATFTSFPHATTDAMIIYRVDVLEPANPGDPITIRYTSCDDLYPGAWIVRATASIVGFAREPAAT
ncbi:hypothetical protein AGRA3207_007496 [Actinomadura graeca]|uniref:Uncharacterized protein n=1 Tax=Actinomadura graeca TaxID=2750812 RepID=A0ABX8R7K1_9ACTN|nr:hypothetical protein [Actinomadura graeca]QXJ25927.1 hypothetical protein AGRA3207_007496 [Actinomadura graeca]